MSDFIMWLDNLIWSTPSDHLDIWFGFDFLLCHEIWQYYEDPSSMEAPPLGLRFHGRTVSF